VSDHDGPERPALHELPPGHGAHVLQSQTDTQTYIHTYRQTATHTHTHTHTQV
jgi:hypothetical protein